MSTNSINGGFTLNLKKGLIVVSSLSVSQKDVANNSYILWGYFMIGKIGSH